MNKIKNALLILTIAGTMITSSGCWDYREINEYGIVAGLAVDRSSDGSGYRITAEIVDLRGAGKEAKIQSKRIESNGATFQEALRNIIKISAKRLYLSHQKILIISQDVARQGIMPIIDITPRAYQPRLTIHILISKEPTASEILSQQSVTTDVRSMEILQTVENDLWYSTKAPYFDMRQSINDLASDGISMALPMVGIVQSEEIKTSELSGTAIFKKDKFIGSLDEEDTKFYLFVIDQIKGGLVTIEGNSKKMTFEIKENKTKIKPAYYNGELAMNINVDTEMVFVETNISIDLFDERERKRLKENAEKTIKVNIENVIDKVKKEYDSDIFGFGRTIKKEMPSIWKALAPDWNKIYRNIPVNVNVNVNIKGSGLTSEPVKIGD